MAYGIRFGGNRDRCPRQPDRSASRENTSCHVTLVFTVQYIKSNAIISYHIISGRFMGDPTTRPPFGLRWQGPRSGWPQEAGLLSWTVLTRKENILSSISLRVLVPQQFKFLKVTYSHNNPYF